MYNFFALIIFSAARKEAKNNFYHIKWKSDNDTGSNKEKKQNKDVPIKI